MMDLENLDYLRMDKNIVHQKKELQTIHEEYLIVEVYNYEFHLFFFISLIKMSRVIKSLPVGVNPSGMNISN